MNWSLLLTLFFEFFKTGLFAVGGGLATVPFLYEMMERYGWFTKEDLMNMIAVSEATPGPMGVNMATYVGFHATGNNILGGIITTIGLVLPSVTIICIIAKFLQKFKNSQVVQDAFYGLRPAVTAMITSAGIGVFTTVLFVEHTHTISWMNLIVFGVMTGVSFAFQKLHPIFMILICAAAGVLLNL